MSTIACDRGNQAPAKPIKLTIVPDFENSEFPFDVLFKTFSYLSEQVYHYQISGFLT
jgi:hypothetical protein